jgi:hypothetical protein
MPLPRFFFDIDDGETVTVDEVGSELEGLGAARAEAMAVLPAIAKDAVPDGDARTYTALVRDEKGRSVFRVTLDLRAEWVSLRPVA